jgi:membrane-bound lytic murein transglycosylase D
MLKRISTTFILIATLIVTHAKQDELNVDYHKSRIKITEKSSDSLYNEWKLKQQISFSDLKDNHVNQLLVNKEYSDSAYRARLERIPSVINLTYNNIVRSHIDVYIKRKRKMSERVLGLSKYYFPIFEQALDKYDMPYEIKYLAIIESALNPRARSRVGASGLWQFMWYTGKRYGLKYDHYKDDRYDPLKATDAACRYLKELHDIFDDWTLALAAYNCGAGRVKRAMRRTGKKNFWDIYYHLPRETRGYVPIFIAAAYMMNYHHLHGLRPVETDLPMLVDTVHVDENIHFKQLAQVLNVPVGVIKRLNPQYKMDVVLGQKKTQIVNLPSESSYSYFDLKDSVYAYNRSDYFNGNSLKSKYYRYSSNAPKGYVLVNYTIKKGDNLGFIAEWFDTYVSKVKSWNSIRNSRRIRIGQKLDIYVPKSKKSYYSQFDKKSFNWKQSKTKNNIKTALITVPSDPSAKYYKVRSGDNLWDISQKHGVSVAQIKELNKISNHKKIKPGMLLLIKKS